MKGLKELLMAKGKSKMDPLKKEAKMGVLSELKDMAGNMMSDDIKGLKKVNVAAPDKESLTEGLEKAEELVDEVPMEMDLPDEEEESETDLADILEGKSDEELEALMELIKARKAESDLE